MSLTLPKSAEHRAAREARQLVRHLAANLSGRGARGPDHGPDRRVPHRNSYDVDSAEATQNWRRVGDGSIAQKIIHEEALLKTAKEHYQQGARDFPLAEVRQAQRTHAALSAELEALDAAPDAPIGRRAVIRQQLAPLAALIKKARDRLRRVDLFVLEAAIAPLEARTGRLFPSLDWIAAQACCHRNSVIAALRRLKRHGFIDWVRRTVKTGADGEFGPQREQTSNAYFFDHRKRMNGRVHHRYLQILVAKLRRLGAVPAGVAPGAPTQPSNPELRLALSGLSVSIDNAST